MATRSAAARSTSWIADEDPVLLAILRAPIEDMPVTEQELADLEEARALGRFVPGSVVTEALAAHRPR